MRAVELFLDGDADGRVRTLWHDLEDIGVPSLATWTHRRHRPHVSLAVAEVVPEAAVPGIGDVLPRPGELELRLASVAVFPGAAGVLHLTVVPTEELLDRHAQLAAHLRGFDAEPVDYYRVGRWSPHCTLAQELSADELGRAVSHIAGSEPFDATVVAAGLTDTRTGEVEPLFG